MTKEEKIDGKKEARTEVFGLRMSPQELQQLEELAKIEQRSMSDTLRVCFIREYRLRVR